MSLYLALLRPLLLPVVSHPVPSTQVAVTVWIMPDTVDTVLWAADDGWRYHTKHVEQFAGINKLYIVASSWIIIDSYNHLVGTAEVQWLRCCVTNRKVAGSIPASVSGFFIDIKSFRSHYGPWADSSSNKNEYQERFQGVKAAGA